jgi:hypothetical protein
LEQDIHDLDDTADEGAIISTEKTSSFNTPATISNAKLYPQFCIYFNLGICFFLYLFQVVAMVVSRAGKKARGSRAGSGSIRLGSAR